jgi:hypothetical protein
MSLTFAIYVSSLFVRLRVSDALLSRTAHVSRISSFTARPFPVTWNVVAVFVASVGH